MYRIISGSKDTYITNRIINNTFRATDANVGLAGTLDLFKLYDESTISGEMSPIELSRLLIKFDYGPIQTLINNGEIDIDSNSFNVTLKLKDVYGGQTTPANFKIIAMPLAKNFDEGKGRDIVNFADIGATNFITASYSNGSANAWDISGARASGSLGSSNLDVYISGSLAGPSGTSIVNLTAEKYFATGKEDLELDITTAVSASLSGQMTNHGFVIAYSGSYETDEKTYFVKRFGSINASNIYDRPSMIVKYDDSILDNHRNFVFDVTGSLFLNNFHRGVRSNILSGTSATQVSGLDCMKLILKSGSYASTHSVSQYKVGNNFKTGIYSASFAISEYHSDLIHNAKSARSASFTQIWASNDLTIGYLTGSLIIKSPFRSSYDGSIERILVTCKNLKSNYRKNDRVKIRVFVENRNEKVIFKKLPTEKISEVYNNMFFRVVDVQKNEVVIPFDTNRNSTRLSSDSDGMFFMIDMNSLTPGRAYKFEFLIRDFDNDFFVNDASGKFIINN